MDDDSELTPVEDFDGDNLPDYLDIDSDNDGIFDVDEGGDGNLVTNDEGVIDGNVIRFSDNDGNGMDDDSELTPVEDFDGDGVPEYQDIDSDNDGIFDVDDGGETEFHWQQLKVKPVKGKTVIWPTDFTHLHRGIVSPTEDKYIATGWFNFLDAIDVSRTWMKFKS